MLLSPSSTAVGSSGPVDQLFSIRCEGSLGWLNSEGSNEASEFPSFSIEAVETSSTAPASNTVMC